MTTNGKDIKITVTTGTQMGMRIKSVFFPLPKFSNGIAQRVRNKTSKIEGEKTTTNNRGKKMKLKFQYNNDFRLNDHQPTSQSTESEHFDTFHSALQLMINYIL